MTLKTFVQYTFFIFFISLLFSCHEKPPVSLTDSDHKRIKKAFSVEELNYFYEIAFYDEQHNSLAEHIIKWNKDVIIYCKGDYTANDILRVKKVINEINSFKLPIKLSFSNIEESANVFIEFISSENILLNYNVKAEGVGNIFHTDNGEIIKVDIAIDKSYKKKNSAILEEIVQSLGLSGDSYSIRSSIYYQGRSDSDTLTTIDTKLIKLLYHPSIPLGLSRVSFEKSFFDIIRPIGPNNKILHHLTRESTKLEILSMIKQTCFINGKLYKFSKDIPVYSAGEFTTKDTIFLKENIRKINNLSQHFSIYYAGVNSNKTQDGIFINYNRADLPSDSLSRLISTSLGKSLYTKRLNSIINLKFRDSIPSQKYPKVFNTIFDSLGPLYAKTTITNEDGKIKENYAQLIDLIYNDVFPDGYHLKDFEKVLIEYQNRKPTK